MGGRRRLRGEEPRDMTQEMDLFVNVYHLKNPELLQKLTDLVQVRRFPRGKVILHSGEQQTQVMLLLEGIVRGYFLDLDGSEHTDCFCIRRGDPAMPPCGLEDPSPINLSTLSDCMMAVLPIPETMQLVQQYPELFNLYSTLMTESMRLHNRIKNTLCNYSAKEKFDWFLQQYPGLIFDINNRYIASFLNMTPETLSRMKSALRRTRSL